MKNRQLITILFLVTACIFSACKKSALPVSADNSDAVELKSGLPFIKGVDLSYTNELEDVGVVYTEDGQNLDPYTTMHNHGANLVRLRLWHNPTWTNYSTLNDVKKSIRRAKDLNMYVLLDFHYSDLWTDPQRNQVPAAWLPVVDNTPLLADSLSKYTTRVLTILKNENLLPDLVQIGNEINNNILVRSADTTGLLPVNWPRNVTLLNAGINAVKAFNSKYHKDIKTILHIAMDPNDVKNWMSNITANGIANFTMLGLSYYPQWQRFDTETLGQLVKYIKTQYGKQVIIAETGHIWTRWWNDQLINLMSLMAVGFPDAPCPQLQKDFLIEVKKAVQANGGAGVIAWEPEWVSASNVTLWGIGSNWENVAFYDFSNRLIKPGGVEFLSDSNVEVKFRVDMTGVDVSQGVYITGEFTADHDGNWQLFPMKQEGTSYIYYFKTYLNRGQSGAYYYLNGNDWSKGETVPVECQGKWTDRLYSIGYSCSYVTYSNVWSSCATIP
ncbi:MAG TPA: glycosyl hydrolase 53 family protein [Bacteroidales bacterium]